MAPGSWTLIVGSFDAAAFQPHPPVATGVGVKVAGRPSTFYHPFLSGLLDLMVACLNAPLPTTFSCPPVVAAVAATKDDCFRWWPDFLPVADF